MGFGQEEIWLHEAYILSKINLYSREIKSYDLSKMLHSLLSPRHNSHILERLRSASTPILFSHINY